MSKPSQTRATLPAEHVAKIRPATAAVMFGALVGLAVGGAYLGGAAAKASTVQGQAQRLDGAAAAGFTEEALAAAAGGLDESALTIARRHDPYTVAGPTQRDRQAELLTARLEQLRGGSTPGAGLRQVNLSAPVAAQPFRLGGALEASRDLDCLTQAVYYEARGEGRDGMRAVAQVVLNRARHPSFPKSVCGVVFQGAGRRTGCQFSFTCDGSMRGRVNTGAWDRARAVASSALSGSVYGNVGNATHFHTTGVAPQWRNSLIRVAQVGDHLFYRFGGRSGASGAFSYAAQRSTDAHAPRLIQADLDTAPQTGPVPYLAATANPAQATPVQASATSTAIIPPAADAPAA
ncbi:MAG: cell wall hydrolase [Brevundimonas sp.]